MDRIKVNKYFNKVISYTYANRVYVIYSTIKSRIVYEISQKYISQGDKNIEQLRKLNLRNKIEVDNKTNHLLPLVPLDSITNGEIYNTLLKEALSNRDITNIAVTGYYGSGKSSILKTFVKNNIKYNYLNISLAHFESKTPELNVIEANILQQIFYKEAIKKIPDSRFKRIKKHTTLELLFNSILVVLFTLLFGIVFKIEYIEKSIPYKICDLLNKSQYFHTIQILSFIAFVLGAGYILTKLIRILNSSKLTKLNFQSGEIEVGEKSEGSIMNKHIDEIIYLFEARRYDIVIIEDLDRFEKNNIFTKLRELNTLINSSEQIDQKVVFIYAVKDDLFSDNLSRVKFFDIIIPVIPFINSTNSYDILIRELTTEKYDEIPNDDFLKEISIYITDKRILNNILNEYFVYKEQIQVKRQENLFAIVVYKNIFPEDFSKLDSGNSNLNFIFESIKKSIEEQSILLDKDIIKLESEIESINQELLIDMEELRKVYVFKFYEKYPNLYSVFIDDIEIVYSQLSKEENFNKLLNKKISRYKYVSNNNSLSYNYEQLDFVSIIGGKSIVDEYNERNIRINEKNQKKVQNNTNRIQDLQIEKSELDIIDYSEFIESKQFYQILNSLESENKIRKSGNYENSKQINSINSKEKELLGFLILNGYIDIYFSDYISNHHEESLTTADREFIINIRSKINNAFNFKLFNVRNVVRELNDKAWKSGNVFNFYLLDYLLENDLFYKRQIEFLIENLKSQTTKKFEIAGYNFKFIKGYLKYANDKNLLNLFQYLNRFFPAFIGLVYDKYFGYEEKWFENKVLYYTLSAIPNLFDHEIGEESYLDRDIVERLDLESRISRILPEIEDFTTIFKLDRRIKLILKEYNVYFTRLQIKEGNYELYEYIINNSHFSINRENIAQYLYYKGFSENDIKEKNYSSTLRLGNDKFIKFIEYNINSYVKNVFLEKEYKVNDNYEDIIKLLNITHKNEAQNLKNETAKSLITKLEYKIQNLDEIDRGDFFDILYELNKIEPTWENVSSYLYEHDWKLNETIVEFLNKKENYELIAKSDFNSTRVDNKFNENLANAIFYSDVLTLDSYKVLIDSINYNTDFFDFKELSEEKVIALSLSRLIRLNQSTYNYLKTNHPYYHHQFLINKYTESDYINDYDIDETDFKYLLSINSTNNVFFKDLVEKFAKIFIIDNQTVANSVSKKISLLGELKIDLDVVFYLISNSTEIEIALRYIILYQKKMNRTQLSQAFSKIRTTPYLYFSEEGRQFTIPNNTINSELIEILENREYITKPKINEKSYSIYVKKF